MPIEHNWKQSKNRQNSVMLFCLNMQGQSFRKHRQTRIEDINRKVVSSYMSKDLFHSASTKFQDTPFDVIVHLKYKWIQFVECVVGIEVEVKLCVNQHNLDTTTSHFMNARLKRRLVCIQGHFQANLEAIPHGKTRVFDDKFLDKFLSRFPRCSHESLNACQRRYSCANLARMLYLNY